MLDKITLLLTLLKEKKGDAMLLTSPNSIAYYTSFHGFALEEREGFALVTQKNCFIITSKLYTGAVQTLKRCTPLIYSQDKPFSKLLTEKFKSEKITRLGVEENNLTLSEYLSLKKLATIVPLNIRHLRIKKAANEIAAIKKACKIADTALAKVKKQIKTGVSEKQIARLLENEIINLSGTTSFRPIVAFSENAAIPHHLTSDKKLKTNYLILIDFGAKVDGYCSDMTRTFFHGKPTEGQKKVYDVVSQAQQKTIQYLEGRLSSSSPSTNAQDKLESRSNNATMEQSSNSSRWSSSREISRDSNSKIKASDVDRVARMYIESQGYPTIPHSLGHGIGLEVHEPPYLGPGSNDILEEGIVFSIEPGIYLEGKFGVRIEDLFVIQNGELIQLTKAPK